MNNFQVSLDRYLTTPPEDGFTGWYEQVIEHLSDDFYTRNEDWVEEEGGMCTDWLNRLFDRSPKEAATIIERAHRMYVHKSPNSDT